MTLVSTTRDRVPRQTAEDVELRIEQQLEENVRYFAVRPAEIARRLRELDQEWDIERAIEANAAVIGLTGALLAARRGRGWLALPALVGGFLFQHAIQGWCPPVPILRRLGFRTSYEIDEERQALKALRGDFDAVAQAGDRVAAALKAARA
jgi:hypothetical protein